MLFNFADLREIDCFQKQRYLNRIGFHLQLTKMEIRNMRPEDEPQVHSLMCCSLDEYFVPEIVSYFRMQWQRGQIVATDLTGKVVGYLAGTKLPNGNTSIHIFCVADGHRGNGLGSMILDRFKQVVALEGFSVIQLEVREDNQYAYRFYSNRGFVPVERLCNFYNDGSSGIRMICDLSFSPGSFSRFS